MYLFKLLFNRRLSGLKMSKFSCIFRYHNDNHISVPACAALGDLGKNCLFARERAKRKDFWLNRSKMAAKSKWSSVHVSSMFINCD